MQQGYADFVMHQLYENPNGYPLEILFMIPVSDTFTLSHVEIDFMMADGSVKTILSRVAERVKAEQAYEDKVASG